ncbi:hypothetical protein MIZ03_1620 [Rhodoferax lithotrophicus]|uniref:Uncharacterized protein n=1 Tax=Rhodoferax lithotrophicus TaxID=2798804 RepID=A0ABM7MKM6_9BURK|nr:hypothetical protein MIZ03_1620 [Rhodoferax sp. MIZ03]
MQCLGMPLEIAIYTFWFCVLISDCKLYFSNLATFLLE